MIGIIHANWNCTQSILIWCKLVMLYTYKEHFISETVIRSIKCCNNWLIDLHLNIHDISEQINQYCFIYAWNQLFHGYNYIIYNVCWRQQKFLFLRIIRHIMAKKKQTRTEIKINYNLLILKINLCAFETLTSEEVYWYRSRMIHYDL